MTSTSDYLLSEFGDSASCPINWPRETGHPLIDRLELEWLNAIRTTAVSSDEAVIAQEILYPHPSTTSDDELTPAIINMTLRRQEAIDLYMTGAGKLQGLDFLRPSYNGKHFKPWTRESDILNWSMSSYSLFLEDHTPSAIQKTFWMWFDDAFKPKPESFQSSEYADSFLLEGFRPVWQIFKNRHQARVAFFDNGGRWLC